LALLAADPDVAELLTVVALREAALGLSCFDLFKMLQKLVRLKIYCDSCKLATVTRKNGREDVVLDFQVK
jgi:hypothetical protein